MLPVETRHIASGAIHPPPDLRLNNSDLEIPLGRLYPKWSRRMVPKYHFTCLAGMGKDSVFFG